MHTLSSAARAVGVARSTIWRAVKAGGLSAHRLTNGTYAIYPGELLRAFPCPPSLTGATIALAERKAISFPVWDVS
jgi:predicted DNA-binding transcriptional regulator AlpA